MKKNPAISRFFFFGVVPLLKQKNMLQSHRLPFLQTKTSEVILKKNVMVKQVELFERKNMFQD